MQKYTVTLTLESQSNLQDDIRAMVVSRLDDGTTFANVNIDKLEMVLDEGQQRMDNAMREALNDPKISAYLHQNDFRRFDTYLDAVLFCLDNTVTYENAFPKQRLNAGEKFAIVFDGAQYIVMKDHFSNRMSDEEKVCAVIDANGEITNVNHDLPDIADAIITFRFYKLLALEFGIESEKIIPSARLQQDLGADSLDLVELTMLVEETFCIDIYGDVEEKFINMATVEEYTKFLIELVKKKNGSNW